MHSGKASEDSPFAAGAKLVLKADAGKGGAKSTGKDSRKK